jgi:hypothetical protein
MKSPAAAQWPKVESEWLYVQLVECAARMVPSRSRGKRELFGMPIEGPVIEVGKRPRGGQPRRPGRFFADPNLVAAHIAAYCVAEWSGKSDEYMRRVQYKVRCADGKKRNTRDAAALYAVELVNKHYISLLPCNQRRHQAEFDAVVDLLNHGRTKWPKDVNSAVF